MGRVKSKRCILAPLNHKQFGYKMVQLYKGTSKRYRKYIHRLVLSAFKPITDPKLVTNHIDANPANNKLENLEWVSQLGNVHHTMKIGHFHNFISDKCRQSLIAATSKKVIRSDGVIFPSMTAAAKAVNGYKECVSECCLGKQKSHKGFSFRFADE